MTTVEKALRVLEPLIPRQVAAWRKALDLSDPQLKRLLETEILSTAHDRLGDFQRKPLFSFPPQSKARGEINLGTVQYDGPRWPTGLSRGELLQNLAVFGRSGAGKTNLTFHILRQLTEKRIPWLFLDWKRTVRHLLPELGSCVKLYTPGRSLAPFPYNPFLTPAEMEQSTYLNHVVDVMGDAYSLGDAARSILHKAIGGCYQDGNNAPSVADLRARIETIKDAERVRGWKSSALRSLDALESFDFGTTSTAQSQQLSDFFRGHTVIELDGLSPSNRKFFIPLLALATYQTKLASPVREQLGLVIVVEEAHHVFFQGTGSYRETLLNQLLRQCREIGIGMIVVDQHPSLISTAVLGNVYTSICMNLRDPKDVMKAAAISGLDSREAKHFGRLRTGEGIVKLQDRWRRPFLVRFPHVPVSKGSVTDQDLERAQRSGRRLSPLSAPRLAAKADWSRARPPRHADEPLSEAEADLLEDVLTHPDDGVDARYKRLSFSVDRGNAAKNRLLARGLLEAERIRVGGTTRLALRHPPSGGDWVTKARVGRGSLTHDFWQRWYARELRRAGYEVRLEAPRVAGTVDVLASGHGSQIAIEIETGKSDIVENVRRNLRSGFNTVVVVAVDQWAFNKCQRLLAAAGLISRRVVVTTVGTPVPPRG